MEYVPSLKKGDVRCDTLCLRTCTVWRCTPEFWQALYILSSSACSCKRDEKKLPASGARAPTAGRLTRCRSTAQTRTIPRTAHRRRGKPRDGHRWAALSPRRLRTGLRSPCRRVWLGARGPGLGPLAHNDKRSMQLKFCLAYTCTLNSGASSLQISRPLRR